jgi:hypothetical protein
MGGFRVKIKAMEPGDLRKIARYREWIEKNPDDPVVKILRDLIEINNVLNHKLILALITCEKWEKEFKRLQNRGIIQ